MSPPLLARCFAAALISVALPCGASTLVSEEFTPEELARGRRHFVVHCARCHGMQGLGGVGPTLARPALANAPDFPSLLTVIEKGIAGTGMPGTWALPQNNRRVLAGYVRTLGRTSEAPIAGDPTRGRGLFEKAACAECHTVAGQGGVKGPDLTEVGRRRGPAGLRRMLTEPGAEKPANQDGYAEYLPVRITAVDGRVVEGLRVNEDGFTIQLRDLENRIHSFRKSGIKEITKGFNQSIMPAFGGVFNASELDDLVAYLANLRGDK